VPPSHRFFSRIRSNAGRVFISLSIAGRQALAARLNSPGKFAAPDLISDLVPTGYR
jgi:hypothetical protein